VVARMQAYPLAQRLHHQRFKGCSLLGEGQVGECDVCGAQRAG
jgi:hypothetical protein